MISQTQNIEYGYHINRNRMDYSSAVNYCKQINMMLVTINNQMINQRIFDIAIQYNLGQYWINGNDNEKEGHWVDSKNNSLTYKNWKRGEPNGDRTENCIHGLFYGNNEWNDFPCNLDNSVICEKFQQTQNIEYGYHINRNQMNYNSAVNYCKKINMLIVTINNQMINKRVYDIAMKYNLGQYWINGNDNAKEGNWVDSENNSLTYKNWYFREPNGYRKENCIQGLRFGNNQWNDCPCNQVNMVICDKTKSKKQLVEYGYLLNKETMNYSSAVAYCMKENMEILTIPNYDINIRIFNIAVKYDVGRYWIDGNDNKNEGDWRDSKNNPLQYRNWKSGEPNGRRNENCIHGLFYPNGLWNDISCSGQYSVICQNQQKKVQTVEYGYLLNENKMNYQSAINYCRSKNMMLVTIKNSQINERVYNIAVKYKIGWYWINGNDISKEGVWVDSQNRKLQFKNWMIGEPNGRRNENCIHGLYYSYAFWNDIYCYNENSVICEPIETEDPEICNTLKDLCFNANITKMCKKTCEAAKKITTPDFISEAPMCKFMKDSCKYKEVYQTCWKTCKMKSSTRSFIKSTTKHYRIIQSTTKKPSHFQSTTNSIRKMCQSLKSLCFNDYIFKKCKSVCLEYMKNRLCRIPYLSTLFSKICNKSIKTTTSIPTTQPQTNYYVEFGYHLTKEKMVYKSALNYCQNLKMDLVTIDNDATNKLVYDLSVKYNIGWYWINGNDNTKEGMWTDANNNPLIYTNWHLAEPDGGKKENCIHSLFYTNGYWNDIECNFTNAVICEPIRYTKLKYHVAKNKLKYDDAVKYCRNRNMELVKIENAETNKLVYDLALKIRMYFYWINGNDKINEGIWMNTDNEEITFRNWYKNQPNGYTTENCIEGRIANKELWNDASCDVLNSVICQPIALPKNINSNSKFYFTKEKMNHSNALKFCGYQNMQIVKIDNSLKNRVVLDFAMKNSLGYYWINGNDNNKEGEWIDSNNNQLDYKNWYSMEPDGRTTENCIIGQFYPDGLWEDTLCDSINSVICEPITNTKDDYHFTTNKMSYETAVQYCQKQNMDLIKIDDAKINNLIYNLSVSEKLGPYWINGNDNSKEGKWIDDRNNPLIFKNWKISEPNGGRKENCIIGNHYPNALWNDAYCNSLNSVICQKIKITKSTYHVSKIELTYMDAIEYCKNKNMSIVKIDNDKENKLIFDMVINKIIGRFWINGNDYLKEGHWVDTENKTLTYKNWNKNEPNNARYGNCIQGLYYSDGTWDDYDCTGKNTAICERKI